MTPTRWDRVKALFDRALDQAPADRSALLDQASETPSVIAEVRQLLEADAQAGGFLPSRDSPDFPDTQAHLSPGESVGGRFRIVNLLG